MPCYHPIVAYKAKEPNANGKHNIVFNQRKGDRPISLPCGQCIACRLNKSKTWAVRCMHEASLYEQNSFVTLTYDEKNLPAHNNLDKTAVPGFLKRLRSSIDYAREKDNLPKHEIRYFYCGEYGDKYQRPHYHLCLFNYDFPDKKVWKQSNGETYHLSEKLTELWGKGHAMTANLTFESAAYVARYITKKQNGPHAEEYVYQAIDEESGECTPILREFANMSRKKGIGIEWYNKFKNDLYPDDFALLKRRDGRIAKVKIPKFYDNKYEAAHPQDFEQIKFQREQAARKNAHDNTRERLKVKEELHRLQTMQLKRGYENDT